MSSHSEALQAVERVIDGGGEADEVLREVVAILHARLGRFLRISFVEDGGLVPGPAAGEETEVTPFPVTFQGSRVADIEASGPHSAEDEALLQRVATLIAPYALVGWDTGGQAWMP